MQAPLAELLQLLELEQLEVNLFRGASRDIGAPQVFGGQVLGQGLRAGLCHRGRSRRPLTACLLPAARRLQCAHRVPRLIAVGMVAVFPVAAWWPSSMAPRYSTWRLRSRNRNRASRTSCRCRKCRRPEALPDLRELIEAQQAPLPPRCAGLPAAIRPSSSAWCSHRTSAIRKRGCRARMSGSARSGSWATIRPACLSAGLCLGLPPDCHGHASAWADTGKPGRGGGKP